MYEVVVTNRIRMQLRDAPPVLLGDVAGIIAVLRVDPTTASSVFQIRQVDDEACAYLNGGSVLACAAFPG